MLNDHVPVGHNVVMNDPQPIDPRRRIRELLAIPERDRTDAEWDELNELEIRTAPGNRESNDKQDRPGAKRPHLSGQPRRQDRNPASQVNQAGRSNGPRPEARPQEGRTDQRPPKRQHRRPKRPTENPGNA